MDKALLSQNVDKFIKEIKTITSREEFQGKMKEYEKQFYGNYEKSIQDNHIDETKKKQFQHEHQENQGFLRAPIQGERDHLQGNYKYNKFSKQQDEDQTLRKVYQKPQDGQFNQYVPQKYNYFDAQANTKQHYPENEIYIQDPHRHQQSFATSQNIYLNRNQPTNFQGQDTKNMYPRKAFGANDHEVPHPFFQAPEPSSLTMQQNIQKLGGIQDTLSVMEPSLREHEKKAFYEKNKFDQFQHNAGVNNPLYQQFPQNAAYQNVQNRPQTSPLQQGPPLNQAQFNFNPFERNQHHSQSQNFSPMRMAQHENYPQSPYINNHYGQQRSPTRMQGQYDQYLNYGNTGNANKFNGDFRNQFQTGPVFLNGAQNR